MWPISAFDWYRRWAEEDPAWPALIGAHGKAVSYAELAERVAAEAGRADLGSPVVLGPPAGSIEWIVALLGALEAGGQPVLAEPGWTMPPATEGAGFWLYTSGTTAQPKPRFRSTEATVAMLQRLHATLPAGIAQSRPRGLAIVPLHHGFGLLNALLLVQYLGGTVHLGPADEPGLAVHLIEERRIDVLYAWPSQFAALADEGAWSGTSCLRWCVSSASVLLPNVAERFGERTGCALRQQYGTTETGPLSVDRDEPPDPACVGTALDGIDVRVVDHRIAVAPAEWFAPQLELADDGLYYPGDLGWQDARGRLFITGRERPFYDERAPSPG